MRSYFDASISFGSSSVGVAQRRDVGMAEKRVVVEVDLGVEAAQLAVLGHDQRIDLEQAHVLVDEGRVELRDELDALLGEVAVEAERRKRRVRPRCGVTPAAGSTWTVRSSPASSCATSSMSMPPSVEATKATRPSPRSTRQRQVELARDVGAFLDIERG